MKFSVATVAAFASVASATNLRSKSNTDDRQTLAGQVYVGGLLHVPTADELRVIDQTVLKAYNKAFVDFEKGLDYVVSSEALVVDQEGTVMISTTLGVDQVLGNDWGCSNCPDEWDDWGCYVGIVHCRIAETLSEADLLSVQVGNAHAKFQKSICKKLRATGIENFAEAKDCSVDILELPGSMDIRASMENAYEYAKGDSMRVEVAMAGVPAELSEADMKVLDSATFEAHNEAFRQTGMKLKDMAATSSLKVEGNTVVLATAHPDIFYDEIPAGKTFNLSFYHKSFEYALCSKLENSGVSTFANVHDCAFRFVFNPAQEGIAIATNAAPTDAKATASA